MDQHPWMVLDTDARATYHNHRSDSLGQGVQQAPARSTDTPLDRWAEERKCRISRSAGPFVDDSFEHVELGPGAGPLRTWSVTLRVLFGLNACWERDHVMSNSRSRMLSIVIPYMNNAAETPLCNHPSQTIRIHRECDPLSRCCQALPRSSPCRHRPCGRPPPASLYTTD